MEIVRQGSVWRQSINRPMKLLKNWLKVGSFAMGSVLSHPRFSLVFLFPTICIWFRNTLGLGKDHLFTDHVKLQIIINLIFWSSIPLCADMMCWNGDFHFSDYKKLLVLPYAGNCLDYQAKEQVFTFYMLPQKDLILPIKIFKINQKMKVLYFRF